MRAVSNRHNAPRPKGFRVDHKVVRRLHQVHQVVVGQRCQREPVQRETPVALSQVVMVSGRKVCAPPSETGTSRLGIGRQFWKAAIWRIDNSRRSPVLDYLCPEIKTPLPRMTIGARSIACFGAGDRL